MDTLHQEIEGGSGLTLCYLSLLSEILLARETGTF